MLILQQLNQIQTVMVAGQEITFTIRPALISDLDLAYVSSRENDPDLIGAGSQVLDNVVNLRAGRSLLLQRIVDWTGVYLSETDPAPCTPAYLAAFFGQYPGAFMTLADLVRQADEVAEKN
jgi:hypothetical protein